MIGDEQKGFSREIEGGDLGAELFEFPNKPSTKYILVEVIVFSIVRSTYVDIGESLENRIWEV